MHGGPVRPTTAALLALARSCARDPDISGADDVAIGVVGVNAPHAFTIAARALQANVVLPPSVLRPAARAPRVGRRPAGLAV